MSRRSATLVVVFLVWTLFVWVGRVRNALTDADLSGSDRLAPSLLAASFVLPALVLLALLVASRGRPGGAPPALRIGVWLLSGWTTAVWIVRAGDIVVGGDHGAAFVAVHVVLAVVSIALAASASRAVAGTNGQGHDIARSDDRLDTSTH